MLKACIGLNCARQIDFIDRRNCQLNDVPEEIYRHEATLEELLLDSNTIQELPTKLFRLTNLRKLSLSENEIMRLSPMIANFTKLVELDLSKNCLEEVPSNIQFCRSLSVLEISCNPLLRIPDCVANIGSLTHLYLNDTALPALPREIGNLQNLIVLEARENVLRRIPPSIGDLIKLQKLDLGNNEIEDLPPTFGYLEDLSELWLDSNCLSLLPESLSRLHNLTILDVTKNKLERFPNHFANLTALADLHASENCIEVLPENFGSMKCLVQIKLDLNHLVYLPDSIGNLPCATEIFLFENMLDTIPASIFNIPTLEMLNVDRNHLMELPSSVGKCKSLHVLSVRENELITLPEEIGQLESLKVLDVCGNKLTHLPVSVSNLQLDAFWIAGNQPQPLISLHQKQDPENPDKKILTCPFLPQSGPYTSDLDLVDNSDVESEEGGSLQHNRGTKARKSTDLQVAFDPGTAGLSAGEDGGGKFVRFPTPFRKDMKNKHKKPKLDARPRTTVFRKGSMDDLTLHAVEVNEDTAQPTESGSSSQTTPPDASPHSYANGDGHLNNVGDSGVHPLLKTSGVLNLSEGYLADESEEKVKTDTESESIVEDKLPPRSKLQTVEVTVELTKDPARGGLGFSIAGGKGSTPAYEDVDESIFITRIIRGGSAEKDGRLRLGDKLLSVNGQDVTDYTHMQAVTALRSTPRKCVLRVSREVLVVLPDDSSYEESKDENSLVENGDVNMSLHNRVTPPLISDEPHSLENTTSTTDSFSGQDSSVLVTEASTGQHIQENESEKNRSVGMDIEGEAVLLDSDDDVLVEEAIDNKEEREEEKSEIDKEMADEDDEIEKLANEMFEGCDIEETEGNVYRDPYINMAVAQSLIEEAKAYQEAEQDRHGEERNADQLQEHESNSHTLDSGHDSPDMMEEKVVLDRSYSTLGMSIVGGADYVNKVFGYGQPGVYISKVSAGGSAAATGKLRIGDKILQVGGVDIEGMSHDEVVEWLISQEGNIEILVRHEPQPKELMEVIINKDPGSKLGISIKGGAPGSHGNPLDPDDEGIFISKITKGEAAEKDGRLRVGHRILEVNGLSLLGASHIEAVHALRSAETSTSLVICHGYSFDDYLKHNQIQLKKPFTGSVDALDQDSKTKTKILVKRSSSSASASVDNIRGGVTKNIPDLKTVLQELEQLRSEPENNYDNELEVHGEKEDPVEEKPIMEKSEVLAALDKSVEEMDETTKEASRLLEDKTKTEDKSLSSLRKESVEQIKERQEGKQEELKTIIDEVFVDLNEYDIISKASSSAANSIEVTPIHQDTNDPPQSEQDDNEWEVLESPEHVKEKQRSQSSSELLSLNTEVIFDRPESADGKRKEGPPISPKPIALISPEKLPFRDRRALYEKNVDPNKDDNRKEFRKSWAPGMLSPRSGSTSPIHTKWPSSSSVGITPTYRDEQSLSVEEMKTILPQNNQLEMNPNNQKELAKDLPAPQPSQRQLTEQNSFGESNLSISSDPPLTGSPMSPPLVDDPGFSPTSLEEEEVKTKNVPKSLSIDEALKQNPYVLQMLDGLPEGVKIDETQLDPPTSEEQARRRAWREQKREEMEKEMEHVRTLLTESESS